MVKDFDSRGFAVSNEFMTNGDVPTLATMNIISHPVNPFTGKEISSEIKKNGKQIICGSHEWNIEKNRGNSFIPSIWYSIHDDIWNRENWKILNTEESLSKE